MGTEDNKNKKDRSQILEKIAFQKPQPFYYYTLADESYKKGEYNKAIQILLEGLKKFPNSIEIQLRAIVTFFKIGEIKKGKQLLEEGLKEFPDNKDLNLIQARIYEGEGKFKKAIEICKKILLLHPEDEETKSYYKILLNTYGSNGDEITPPAIEKEEKLYSVKEPITLDKLLQFLNSIYLQKKSGVFYIISEQKIKLLCFLNGEGCYIKSVSYNNEEEFEKLRKTYDPKDTKKWPILLKDLQSELKKEGEILVKNGILNKVDLQVILKRGFIYELNESLKSLNNLTGLFEETSEIVKDDSIVTISPAIVYLSIVNHYSEKEIINEITPYLSKKVVKNPLPHYKFEDFSSQSIQKLWDYIDGCKTVEELVSLNIKKRYAFYKILYALFLIDMIKFND